MVTLVDYFSKWPDAAPLKDKTAASVALFLFETFCRYVNDLEKEISYNQDGWDHTECTGKALEKGVCRLENAYGRVLKTAVNRCRLKKFNNPTPLLTTTKVITNIILIESSLFYTYREVDNACY